MKAKFARRGRLILLLLLSLSALCLADSISGFLMVKDTKLTPRDAVLVYDKSKEVVKVLFTEEVLSVDEKKYLAGHAGNVPSEQCGTLSIPVRKKGDRLVPTGKGTKIRHSASAGQISGECKRGGVGGDTDAQKTARSRKLERVTGG